MFGTSLKHLIWLCRTMATMLDAGVPMSRVLTVVSSQAPRGRLRGALGAVEARVKAGSTLAEAFQADASFPRLLVQLVSAGEASGTLERAFAELARFYEFQQGLWRHFLGQIALPVMQYVAAVAVIAVATYITRMIGGGHGGLLPTMLAGYGVPAVLVAGYFLVVKRLGGTRIAHEIILRIPVLGNVMRDLALARFSLVMYVMYEAGVPIVEALRRAFDGTNNGAFAARADIAAATIQRKGTFTEALRATGLFPTEYMEVISVAEESGKLSERLDWLTRNYADKARASLHALVSVIAKLIYAIVALIIIYYIFMFFSRYVGMLQGAMR